MSQQKEGNHDSNFGHQVPKVFHEVFSISGNTIRVLDGNRVGKLKLYVDNDGYVRATSEPEDE